MLSYRHAFHAGNFADVLKHSALTLVLDYMTQKDKGFSYIDSHSGAGMYSLSHDYAQKTGEYKSGVAKLIDKTDLPAAFIPYQQLIKRLNTNDDLLIYPGSPGIAKLKLRKQDNAHLYELHSTDITLLQTFCEGWKKSRVHQSDGYAGVLSQLPPPTRRGVVLIDPPYELKEDYLKAVQTLIDGYKKFATGTYILWYPVVTRNHIDTMEEKFKSSKIKNLLKVEFSMSPDSDEYGMTGTGLFIINPPWTLADQMADVLSSMKTVIGTTDSTHSINQLIPE